VYFTVVLYVGYRIISWTTEQSGQLIGVQYRSKYIYAFMSQCFVSTEEQAVYLLSNLVNVNLKNPHLQYVVGGICSFL
jgi:hypothetical protein